MLSSDFSSLLLRRAVAWATGLSLSSVLLLLIFCVIGIVLRSKGYGVRPGLACIVFYAKPGSRRFPNGVEVRCTTRVVGFIFNWFQGPLIDIYADRFYMRLRSKSSPPSSSSSSSASSTRRSSLLRRLFQHNVPSVNRSYWAILLENFLTRCAAHLVRFLRVRVGRIRIWKDSGLMDLKVEQFVLSGHAYNIFGCKYCMSVNELQLTAIKHPISDTVCKVEPVQTTLSLPRGIEIDAFLGFNLLTVFRRRRFAILDNLRFSVVATRIGCFSPKVLYAHVTNLNISLSPGRSRSLMAKLPYTAPSSRRPNEPSLLQYWECSASVKGVSLRFSVPTTMPSCSSEYLSSSSTSVYTDPHTSVSFGLVTPPPDSDSANGFFLRLDSLQLEAFGKTAEERADPMMYASLTVRGCSAGSSSVDELSHSLYEIAPVSLVNSTQSSSPMSVPYHHHYTSASQESASSPVQHMQSHDNIERIVKAKPELLLWVEDLSLAVDKNCARHHITRVDVGSRGGFAAIEPVGLVMVVKEVKKFAERYWKREPRRRQQLSFGGDDDSSSSYSSRSGSLSSVSTSPAEQSAVRVMCDMWHWTGIVLGRGPVGDGDTLAVVATCEVINLSEVALANSSLERLLGTLKAFQLTHWSHWGNTRNIDCGKADFDIMGGKGGHKDVKLNNLDVLWDMDAQSALEMLPSLFSSLKDLKSSTSALSTFDNGDDDIWMAPNGSDSGDKARLKAMLNEQRQREAGGRRSNALESLSSWTLTAENTSLTIAFPDGPKLRMDVADFPTSKLSERILLGRHVVVTMQDRKCAYAEEFRMGSPLHTLRKDLEKRSIEIDFRQFVLVMGHDVQFGYLLQDWLLRLRSAIRIMREQRWAKRGLNPPATKKQPMPDIHFKTTDLEIYFDDHPISAFLTRMLPLMQDEAEERLLRDEVISQRQDQLRKIPRAEITGTPDRFAQALKMKDSAIWVDRVKALKSATAPRKIANGYLPGLDQPPAVSIIATTFNFDVTLDDLGRQMGSAESIRRLKLLDDYELGNKLHNKTRQYDRDVWNSIGFRGVAFDATGVSVQLRDYPLPFLVMDHMYFDNTTMGQAVQETKAPYVSETTVAIGRRRLAKIQKGLGPTKSFVDIHLKVDRLHCNFNPAYLTGIADFGRGVSRFFSGGKNPSPRIPWFDSLRVTMHGRMRLTAAKFTGILSSSSSPYSTTDHFVEIESDNFEMLTSRLNSTKNDPFPICWKFHDWRVRPSSFVPERQSEIIFNYLQVGMTPSISVASGDAQDHYFVPFPSKEEVAKGGPHYGRGSVSLLRTEEPVESSDNGFGNFTDWWTGLHEIPDADSFADYKTRTMVLGLDICVRQTKPNLEQSIRSRLPASSSVMYSDAISTLTQVIKTIVQRPISCRLPPRLVSQFRKPPSKTGLSTSLCGLNLNVDAKNINIMMYNNLEPGHGLFVSLASLSGELRKTTKITILENGDVDRKSDIMKRRLDIVDIYTGIQVPGLDMAVDGDDMGKLFTVGKISLSDEGREEDGGHDSSPRKSPTHVRNTSGFGTEDLDDSPFYTFSKNHPLQRGKPLDKVSFDKRLIVDRVRLIWSPLRRMSMFAWPDAFKLKTFTQNAPKTAYSNLQNQPANSRSGSTTYPDKNVRTSSVLNPSRHMHLEEFANTKKANDEDDSTADPGLTAGQLSRETSVASTQTGSCENSAEEIDLTARESRNSGEPRLSAQPVLPTSPLTRSKAIVKRKHVGSMVDLLTTKESSQFSDIPEEEDLPPLMRKKSVAMDTLKSNPKFSLYIKDCEVVFGSTETIGHVFLTSKAVRVGIVDKDVHKPRQIGAKTDSWVDREYRFHLEAAEVYTRDKAKGEFDFSLKDWIPKNATDKTMCLLTQNPISMDLLYVTSSSSRSGDSDTEEDDQSLRPSLLFINVPHIRLSTNAEEFHAMTDVVRKVLMQSMRSSELVTEELAKLRYKIQLNGGNVSSAELENYLKRLNTIIRQMLYAGDTYQFHLVENLALPGEKSFADTLLRYKAKAKAVATFLRKDQRANMAKVLYPTMYISYSFDECSWELREVRNEQNKVVEDAFVAIALENLVCRHIFYVGRGSSTEVTFQNIYAQNKMQYSYFKRILQPAVPNNSGGKQPKVCGIKASDGATVAFRWYSTQEDRVGGIPVYEILTIQLAPMIAALTRKLYSSVQDFVFSTRTKANGDKEVVPKREARRGRVFSRSVSKHADNNAVEGGAAGSSNIDQTVSQMAKRGESNILFKYIFIDAFELTASYKNKDSDIRSALDVFDLVVRTPSFSYSSEVWTWKQFSSQIGKDLVKSFFIRGAANLAKLKLLPGYNRARRHIVQGADTVKERFHNPFPSPSHTFDTDGRNELSDDEDRDGLEESRTEENLTTDVIDEEDPQDKIDAAVLDIGGASDPAKRERVLRMLYGRSVVIGASHTVLPSTTGRIRSNIESGSQNSGLRARARAFAARRNGNSENRSAHSHDTGDGEGGKRSRLLRRLRRRGQPAEI